MYKKSNKTILKGIMSIILGVLVLSSSCYKGDGDATVTIHFKGNNIAANNQPKHIIDRILSIFSKPAYAAWNIPCNRLILTISGENINEQIFDTGFVSSGITDRTFTAVVQAVANVNFEVLSFNGTETKPNWGGGKIVTLSPGNQGIDITMVPMTGITSLARTSNSVTITFDNITSYCQGYNIYRSTEANNNYKLIGKANASSISFIDNSAENNQTYYYRVSVINANEEGLLCAAGLITTTNISIDMVYIVGGTFIMGSPTTEPDRQAYGTDETQHSVTVSSYYMSKYEVTQEQYEAVMGYNDSSFTGTNLPVEYVTWYDAVEFCNKLSVTDGLDQVYTITGRTPTTGYPITSATVTADWSKNGYRLPTEAEWEYACRAGTGTAFNWGTDQIMDTQANFDASSNPYNGSPLGIFQNTTIAVGSFAPNVWGLYDMHGNVLEWCWDWYGTYPGDGEVDYRGPISGSSRVARGGSWCYYASDLRSAIRHNYYPYSSNYNIGLRVVRKGAGPGYRPNDGD